MTRAWALWVNCKLSFAAKIGGSFGFDKKKRTSTKKLHNAKDAFTELLCARLEKVTIECQDAIRVIKRYDTKDAFHFVDPPYINSNCGHYEGMFNHESLINLLEVLSHLQGKFMLTMFPHETIKDFANRYNWKTHSIQRTISVSLDKRKKKEEWIVMNY